MNNKTSTKISDDEKLKILYDHYKDSFTHAKEFLDRRDRVFYILLVVLGLTLLQISSPGETSNIASEVLSRYGGMTITVDVNLANSVLWFALLSLLIRYYQTVVYIQRIYPYIHSLEDQISKLLGQAHVISREGKYYQDNYPRFSEWSWQLYTVFFPVLVILLTGVKVVIDIRLATSWSFGLIINIVIFVAIALSTLLYILMLHFKK